MHEKRMTARYFLLSFAIGFLILSVTAMMAVLTVPPQAEAGASSLPDAETDGVYFPSASDAGNLLLILSGADGASAAPGRLYLLLRFDPLHGQIAVTGLPGQTRLDAAGAGETLDDMYRYAGAARVMSGIERDLGVKTGRYLAMDEAAVVRMVDLLGGARCRLREPVTLAGGGAVRSTLSAGEHDLGGGLFAALLRHDGYRGGEAGRAGAAAEMVAALINGRLPVVLTDEADSLFRQLVNCSSTNISIMDYQSHRAPARFMAKLLKDPAYALPSGARAAGGGYRLAEDARARLIKTFAPGNSGGQPERVNSGGNTVHTIGESLPVEIG